MRPDEEIKPGTEAPRDEGGEESEFPPREEKFVEPEAETVEKVIEHGRHMGF